MIRLIPLKNIRHIPARTHRTRIILARTRRPLSRVLDVHFSRWVVEAESETGEDGDEVFFIVDVRERGVGGYVVGPGLIAHLCVRSE